MRPNELVVYLSFVGKATLCQPNMSMQFHRRNQEKHSKAIDVLVFIYCLGPLFRWICQSVRVSVHFLQNIVFFFFILPKNIFFCCRRRRLNATNETQKKRLLEKRNKKEEETAKVSTPICEFIRPNLYTHTQSSATETNE